MSTSIATAKPDLAGRELAIRKMMESCYQDPRLFAELLKAPKEFSAKHGVTLEAVEEAQLKRLSELVRVIDDFTAARIHGPGPIFYPVDLFWKRALADHILNYQPIYNPLFHRGPDRGYYVDIGRIQGENFQQFGMFRR